MCDYDGDGTLVRSRHVTIRKDRRCWNCRHTFPTGARMVMATCRESGPRDPFYNVYECQTCELMLDEDFEDTPLHICAGGLGDDYAYPHSWQRYRYVRHCLEEGEPVIMAVLQLIADGFLEQEMAGTIEGDG